MECQPAADVAALLAKEGATGPPGGGAYSLVLHPGDLAYARGYGALWDAWLLQQQPLASRVPYAVAIGNHERDVLEDGGIPYRTVDSGGEGGVPFGARFPLPTPTPGAVDQPWYAFDHGPIHFTVMSTEVRRHAAAAAGPHRGCHSPCPPACLLTPASPPPSPSAPPLPAALLHACLASVRLAAG